MADVFNKRKRSQVMSQIRSKDTKAEKIVFSFLRKRNIYFQKHYARVRGKPDIALPRKKKAVFIDGDFWHGKTLDSLIRRRGKEDTWVKKIQANVVRDRVTNEQLVNNGWKVLRIDEKDILRKSTSGEALKEIEGFLTK